MRHVFFLMLTAAVFGAGCSSSNPSVSVVDTQPAAETTADEAPKEPIIERVYEPGKEFAALRFVVPQGLAVEYIDAIKSLNIYATEGDGTTLERSQIFIRFFDAERFLTLSTVKIHSVTDLAIGKGNYVARRYDIEKRPGVPNFLGQPTWRNTRHIVTDTRKNNGFTRYYVIAKNPALDQTAYEAFLEGLEIVE